MIKLIRDQSTRQVMLKNPLLWLAVGSGAVAVWFLTKKKEPAPAPPPKTYGEATVVSLPVPSGWRRVTNSEVTPELQAQANALLSTPGFASMPYGTLIPFTASDGWTYATWIEQHYHPPGGAAQPWGLHHGVTLLAWKPV